MTIQGEDMSNRYPIENLPDEYDGTDAQPDDGTMPENLAELTRHVVGRRVVKVERNANLPDRTKYEWVKQGTILTLDNGAQVALRDREDCCAYTELEEITLHLDKIDHVITGVGTTGGYTTWHIYADFGDVVEMQVGWSGGNLGYYGYGFDISVITP